MKIPELSKANKNSFNIPLNTKCREQTALKEIKNIRNYLLNLAKIDLNESNSIKITVFVDKEEEKKKNNFIMVAPIGFKHYLEDFKKLRDILPEKKEEGETTPSSTADTIKQIDSSDFSVDEEEKIL